MTAYTVTLSDGSRSILIPPRQVSENLASIPLLGEGLSGYGNIIATAQLRMLENFASETPPNLALEGQTWYDKDTQSLRVLNDQGNWQPVGEPAPSELNDLSDVTINSPQNNDWLRFVGGQWVNQQLTLKFTDLSDTPASLANSPGSFLRVNAGGTALELVPRIPVSDIQGRFSLSQLPLQEICAWMQQNCP